MKINLNIPFRNFAGEPITVDGKKNGVPIIMGEYIGKTLFGFGQGGPVQLDQKETMAAYEIIRKLQTNMSEVSLSSEEITFIKEKMVGLLTVGCYGQLYRVLEQEQ